jgi:hypothetical protein
MSQVYIGNGSGGSGAGGIETIEGDIGSITGSTVTIYADNAAQQAGSSVLFDNSGTISTLEVTDANGNTIIGKGSGNATLTGTNNASLGATNLTALTSGINNICIGTNAGNDLTSGSRNIAIGVASLRTCSTNSNNTCVGNNAGLACTGSTNTLLGFQAGNGITSGSTNTCLGEETGSAYTTESNNIVIGPALAGIAGDSSVCRIANIFGTPVTGSLVGVTSTSQLGTISASSIALVSLTPNFNTTGGTPPVAITGNAGNIDILGTTVGASATQVVDTLNTSGTPATGNLIIEDRTFVSPYVVDASTTIGARGTYTTIQAAITAAAADGAASATPLNVYIRPGTYTENPTMQPGVNLVGLCDPEQSSTCIVNGTLTYTQAGNVNINNLTLQTNSLPYLSVTGTAASTVNLINCNLNATNNTGIVFSSSVSGARIKVIKCYGDLGTTGIAYFTHTSAGGLSFYYTNLENSGGSTTASTSTTGSLNIRYSFMAAPITTSGTSSIGLRFSYFDCDAINTTAMTVGGSGASSSINSKFEAGSATALSIGTGASLNISEAQIRSSNTNAVSGVGTIQFNSMAMTGSSSLINTTTQQLFPFIPGAQQTVSPAGNYTILVSDMIIAANSSSSHTITLPATPSNGEVHVIKDITGTAGTNNITISGNGNNIDGSSSKLIATNYGNMRVTFIGTAWFTI